MTECQYYQELICRLTDEELSPREHSALSAHVETCKQCMTMYAVFSDLSDIIKNDVSELPDGLHENIMASIHRTAIVKKNRRRFSGSTKNLIAAAACFAVVLLTASGIVTKFSREASSKVSADTVLESTAPAPSAAASEAVSAQPKAGVDAASPEAGEANAAIYASPKSTAPVATAPPQVAASPAATADPYLGQRAVTAPEPPPQPEHTAAPQAQAQLPPTASPDNGSSVAAEDAAAAPASAAPQSSAAPAAVASASAPVSPTPNVASAASASGDGSQCASEPTATPAETPSASSRFSMSFRSMLDVSEEAVADQPNVTVDMTKNKDSVEAELWTELHKMLNTAKPAEAAATANPTASPRPVETPKPTELPSEKPDRVFDITLTAGGTACNVLVYQYSDALYYSVPKELDNAGTYLAKCSVDDFKKFISVYPTEGLAAEEYAVGAE